jgi:hypothetical protein
MSWKKKDIIDVIKKEGLDIDINLPYWELRAKYHQTVYHRMLMGSGSRSMALSRANIPPPDS